MALCDGIIIPIIVHSAIVAVTCIHILMNSPQIEC